MTKTNYALYNTQDSEFYYYIQANNIESAAKQAKDKYPGYAVAPYALTSVTEANCGKVDWASWTATNNGEPEIYKFRGSHGGYRPGSGAKKTLPDNATPRSIRLTDAEYLAVKEFIKSLRSENKMTIEAIKQAAKDFANNAEHVDNCERLGYVGLINEAKADETAALSRLVKRIDEAGMTIEGAVKAAKLPWPIEKTLKNGGRW